jgi:hypothetical protein
MSSTVFRKSCHLNLNAVHIVPLCWCSVHFNTIHLVPKSVMWYCTFPVETLYKFITSTHMMYIYHLMYLLNTVIMKYIQCSFWRLLWFTFLLHRISVYTSYRSVNTCFTNRLLNRFSWYCSQNVTNILSITLSLPPPPPNQVFIERCTYIQFIQPGH